MSMSMNEPPTLLDDPWMWGMGPALDLTREDIDTLRNYLMEFESLLDHAGANGLALELRAGDRGRFYLPRVRVVQ
jgi:hypothetical protein